MLPYKVSQNIVDFLPFQRTNEEAGTINRLGHHKPDIYRESLDLSRVKETSLLCHQGVQAPEKPPHVSVLNWRHLLLLQRRK